MSDQDHAYIQELHEALSAEGTMSETVAALVLFAHTLADRPS